MMDPHHSRRRALHLLLWRSQRGPRDFYHGLLGAQSSATRDALAGGPTTFEAAQLIKPLASCRQDFRRRWQFALATLLVQDRFDILRVIGFVVIRLYDGSQHFLASIELNQLDQSTKMNLWLDGTGK